MRPSRGRPLRAAAVLPRHPAKTGRGRVTVDSVRALCSPAPNTSNTCREAEKSTDAVLGSVGSVQMTNAPRAAETRSRSADSPQTGQRWSRSARVLETLCPHRQCWDSAVVNVAALASRPPAAEHSTASAAVSMPGVNTAHALPHNRNQTLRLQSSTVRRDPCSSTSRAATVRARARRASARPACSARARVCNARWAPVSRSRRYALRGRPDTSVRRGPLGSSTCRAGRPFCALRFSRLR